jgi:hypothetical protein
MTADRQGLTHSASEIPCAEHSREHRTYRHHVYDLHLDSRYEYTVSRVIHAACFSSAELKHCLLPNRITMAVWTPEYFCPTSLQSTRHHVFNLYDTFAIQTRGCLTEEPLRVTGSIHRSDRPLHFALPSIFFPWLLLSKLKSFAFPPRPSLRIPRL